MAVNSSTNPLGQITNIKRFECSCRLVAGALLSFFILTAAVHASGVDGVWQHPDDPVWIEVNLEAGTGIARRNDDQPETVGFHVVKGLAASNNLGAWQGEVFVPQIDGYKAVLITLPDEQTLRMTVKFGFIRRSVEWSRVEAFEGVTPR